MNTWEGGEIEERETNHKRLLRIENKLGVAGGWWWGVRWVLDTKESTCDENWVFYVSDESPNSTPKTNIAVCIN